jgi:CxxC-x17-CxxC domain-containing protein
MPNYNNWEKRGKPGGDRPFRKPDFHRPERRDFNGSGFDKPMFQAVCVECGNRCEVPFKPVNGKPVFCRDCFRKEDRGGSERSFPPRRDDRPQRENRFESAPRQSDNRTDFEQLNRKLDTIMELLKIAKNQPAKEIKVHTVASEAMPKTGKTEEAAAQTEDPKASKKKAAKATAPKADKKKKK